MNAALESSEGAGLRESRNADATRPDWLANAAPDWPIMKLSHLALLRSGHTPNRSTDRYWVDCTIPWITLSDVKRFRDDALRKINETDEKISIAGLANSSAELLPRGTVILSRTASVGFSAIMSTEMATTQDFANWVCGKRLDPEYLWYCLKAMRPEFERLMMGSTHKTIYMPDINSLKIPSPEPKVQRDVVELLDRETARIDTLIAKQKQLIELLKEKRQAVISQAVTKGLDPDVPMKDSGVEWLGKVPVHWSLGRVKDVSRFVTSGPRNWSDFVVESGEAIFLQSGDLSNNRTVVWDGCKSIHPPNTADLRRCVVQSGDVLVCITGANTGRVAIVAEPPRQTIINQHLSLIRFGSRVRSEFAAYYLASAAGQAFYTSCQYGLKEGLSLSNVRDAWLPIPSVRQQQAITCFLDSTLARLAQLLKLAESAIALLRERRAALISAAVTGQIDVTTYGASRTDKASAA